MNKNNKTTTTLSKKAKPSNSLRLVAPPRIPPSWWQLLPAGWCPAHRDQGSSGSWCVLPAYAPTPASECCSHWCSIAAQALALLGQLLVVAGWAPVWSRLSHASGWQTCPQSFDQSGIGWHKTKIIKMNEFTQTCPNQLHSQPGTQVLKKLDTLLVKLWLWSGRAGGGGG